MGIPPDAVRKRYLESLFPLLALGRYAIRAPGNSTYNCVAWAMGSTTEWWWPDSFALWPIREKRVSVKCFTRLFEAMGLESAADASIEPGYFKIALYVLNGIPTHVARIESATVWSSKLGRDELIEHMPDALNGVEYGAPRFFFRKKQ